MKLRLLFEKQVFVRLSQDHSAFICTTKWPVLSRARRIGIGEAGLHFALRAAEQGSTHQTAEFEGRIYEL
jgi:hypothetical protein